MTAVAPASASPSADEPGDITHANGRRLWTGRWSPADRDPRAVVILLHGYAEYLGRYDHVIPALTAAGYVVDGLDHHGHGRSAGRRAALRAFDHYVDDAELLLDRVLARDPARPVFIYGHSMGGLIAARLALRRQEHLAGLILSGPALRIALTISPLVRRLGLLLDRIAPDLPLVPTAKPGILASDPEVAHRFAADPLNYHGRARLRFSFELERAAADTLARAEQVTLPLLVIHGADDTFTDLTGSQDFVARAASPDKTFIPWSGLRHEIHNEPRQADVLAAITAWLTERTAPGPRGPVQPRRRRHPERPDPNTHLPETSHRPMIEE